MGKNVALAIIALALTGIGLWLFTSEASSSNSAVAGAGSVTPELQDARTSALALPEPAPIALPANIEALEERQHVPATEAVHGFVDLDFIVTNPGGVPIPGTKCKVHLETGKVLTRWTSQAGEFTLLDVPVGELAVSVAGRRIDFPNVDEPTKVTTHGTLKVQVSGTSQVACSIYSDSLDEGELRLYRTIHVEQLAPSPRGEQIAQQELAKQQLMEGLRGQAPQPSNGQQPFDRRAFYRSPDGQLVASLTGCSFPGEFDFHGLDPGTYELVADSRQHAKRIAKFEVNTPSTRAELDLTPGYQILVAAQYRSGELPDSATIRLLDRFGTDKPRRTIGTSEPTDSGRWTFRDLEPGTWFVEVRPGPRSIGRLLPIVVPSHTPSVPVLDLLLDQPRATTLELRFHASEGIVLHEMDRLVAVIRQSSGEYLGERNLTQASLQPATKDGAVELNLGRLFPGEYEVYLYSDPTGRRMGPEGWLSPTPQGGEAPFEAKILSLSVPVGAGPVTVEVSLDWFRSPNTPDPYPKITVR